LERRASNNDSRKRRASSNPQSRRYLLDNLAAGVQADAISPTSVGPAQKAILKEAK
jgi:hypothetical protein